MNTAANTNTTNTTTNPVPSRSLLTRLHPVGLMISAVVLAGLVLVQGGALLGGNAARAEMTSSTGDFTMMTTDAGSEEMLVVIDQRREVLLVYFVEQNRRLQLADRQSLPDLFTAARRQARGGP